MSIASRNLQVGDVAVTDFSGKLTEHRITDRIDGQRSQSRIMFKVVPIVPKSSGDWIDSDWFEPKSNV